jgi:hypothetical protein
MFSQALGHSQPNISFLLLDQETQVQLLFISLINIENTIWCKLTLFSSKLRTTELGFEILFFKVNDRVFY